MNEQLQDLEAEQATLRVCLLSPVVINQITGLDSKHLTDSKHKVVFKHDWS